MITINTYETLKPNATYEMWVSGLFEHGYYRCNLMKEDNVKTSLSVDLNLVWHSHRRWLEGWVKDLQKTVHLKFIVFGNGGCMNDVHYPLDIYKQNYGAWRGMEFINDLNLQIV